MPNRYTKQNELQQLQYEITNEISRDAAPIARGVFGNNARHPDMATVSNAELDDIYRQAFLRNDRTFLQQEAQRDPVQFLAVTDRLGVPDPPTDMGGKPMGVEPGALGKALTQGANPTAPPVAAAPVVPPPVPPVPMAPPMAPPVPVPPPLPGMPAPVPMAEGGIVTEPTLAVIGENGPEAVVPLTPGAPQVPLPQWNANPPIDDPRDSRLYPQSVNTAVPEPEFQPPQPGEIESYIRQAAAQRNIDPDIAVKVAFHEGGVDRDPNSATYNQVFVNPAVEARFNTGRSWWPFQLHYGGKGYEQYGDTAGMGNDFTREKGWQPGDPKAWVAATDYALDEVLRTGWAKFYGRGPAGVAVWQGVPSQAVARRP